MELGAATVVNSWFFGEEGIAEIRPSLVRCEAIAWSIPLF